MNYYSNFLEQSLLATIPDEVQLYLAWASVLGPVIPLIILIISLLQSSGWNKKKFAMDIVFDWNNKTAESKATIEKKFPKLFVGKITPISKAEANSLYKSKLADDIKVRQEIDKLLNHLEAIAVACNNKAVNEEIIRSIFKSILMKFYRGLETYIKLVDEKEEMTWKQLIKCVDNWKPRAQSNSSPALPQVGR